ncbi:GPW/gp25 family protein [Nitrosomonas sp.]|uniref:GPW/gp25 family protein n=1 Tax=Nitrosomonas sp. TaxID=42353 RepID=UPI0028463C61|nr:GPW/gp25 family protein [Nitrosomonas sp.]MDR4515029.1 GPW/gp25 family protein [Nitrosomonas sp.]
MATRLNNPDYMKFPLQIGESGAVASNRQRHVREQIEQVLFTDTGERWYRPEFGIGVRALVFEPNSQALWEVTKKRLSASLSDALAGEVAPASLEVNVTGDGEKLYITIAYTLATLNQGEQLEFVVGGSK